MAAKPDLRYELIGEYDCWSCKKPAPVRRMLGSGNLSAPCSWCDYAHYARPGTKHHEALLAATRLYDKPKASEPAKPAQAEAKKPAPPAPSAEAKPAYPWMRPAKTT